MKTWNILLYKRIMSSLFACAVISLSAFSQSNVVPLDVATLAAELSAAPMESTDSNYDYLLYNLPMPDGSTQPFKVMESPMMSADFQATYPLIKTYAVVSVADPSVNGRLTVTPNGFFAAIITQKGMALTRPLDLNNPVLHEITYDEDTLEPLDCHFDELDDSTKKYSGNEKSAISNGSTRRTYDLAIVTTGEFYQANGGTAMAATAVVTSTMNAIQAIYDRELAVRFNLLAPFHYTNPATDPFNPGLNRTLEAAQAVNTNFPGGNYDIGHVFHDQDQVPAELPGGGVAGLGVVCNGAANGTGFLKASGWSGSFSNTGNGWIRLAAHEFGHMFDMNHTFNGNGSNCSGGNLSLSTAYEIASGSTIMSYNGICGAGQNLPSATTADNYFHTNSLTDAVNYIAGENCHTATATGNTPPVVNANPCGGAYTIPIGTPFRLTGSGTDANNETIYYSWEQYDEDGAGVSPTHGFIGATAAASNIAPLFRSYPPTTSPTRTFPNMSLVAANSYASDFEPLPTVARTLNFRLFGRDFNINGGGIHCSPLAVTVSGSGPFAVTAPNGGETLTAGNNTTVTWSVNGTNAFCTNVNIKMSVDGGQTFPYTLATSTPNDGSQSVSIPAGVANTSSARVMVECADNLCVVFFDISNANFTVNSACVAASSNICTDSPVSLPVGDPGLNLGLNGFYGSPITTQTFNIVNGDPSGQLSSLNAAGNACTFQGWNNEYRTQAFTVGTTGSYTFSISGSASFSGLMIYSPTYNPASACTNFVGSNYQDAGGGSTNISGSVTVTLNACQTYVMVASTLNATPPFSVTISASGPGTVFQSNASPGANYSYTYAAVNTSSGQVAAVSATSNFTGLAAGSYQVYGASYYSGAGPSPATVTPANWIGQTPSAILSGGSCVLFSTNYKSVTVTGGGNCTPPTVNAPTVTQPTCPSSNGIIVVNATGSGVLEYSVNNGVSWQTSSTFNNLGTGSYNIVVRLQANPTCFTNYGANPVVLNGPPTMNAPTVTQPSCLTPTGTIVVNATSSGTLEYSVNNGTNWQASATFSNLAAGSYTLLARLQASPTCQTAYAANPVVLNPATSDPCTCNNYCAASQTTGTCSSPDEFISNVTFNTINNSSTCAESLPSGYTNYTSISTSVNTGSSHTLNVTNGGPFAGDQCKAWFDWNADGDFSDAGEEFTLAGSGINSAQFWTVNVPVPGTATAGTTRMRIRVKWNAAPTACGSQSYSETEDYCVTIVSACTPPTVNAPTVTQPTCSVTTGTIVVNATGSGTLEYSVNGGTSWQASSTFANLTPGNYNIRVRLQANPTCFTNYASNPVAINAAPTAPTVNAPTVTQPTCSVTTGTIVVNATGSGTLEYSVNGGTSWQASSTFANLTPGNYNIRVRLQANPTCFTNYASNPVVINAVPTAPTVNAPTVTQPTCAGPQGTIVVNATGSGTLEYSVNGGTSWQLSNNFNGLTPGNYNIRVRLQANPTCFTNYASNPVVINAVPTAPTMNAPTVTQPPSCAVQTGTIVINATGSSTLEYSVNNGGNWQLSPTFTGLAAGAYALVARLQNNPTCQTAYIGNPVELIAPAGCCNLPTYTNSCASGDIIQDFTFGSFSNLTTGCGTPGTNNYTSYIGTGPSVQAGETYAVTIRAGSENQHYGIYIDFNNNGSYLDAGEFFNVGQATAGNTVTVNITIPADAPIATRTLRVRSSYDGPLTADDGCNTNLEWGEVEDYNIFIFCPVNLAVNGVPIPNGSHSADQELTSAGTVANGTDVTFFAGNGVALQPNFEVALGGIFTISIASCFP